MPRNEITAVNEGLSDGVFDSRAAGNLHSYDGNAFDIVIFDYFRELFGIINAVELRTSDKRYSVFNYLQFKPTAVKLKCLIVCLSAIAYPLNSE